MSAVKLLSLIVTLFIASTISAPKFSLTLVTQPCPINCTCVSQTNAVSCLFDQEWKYTQDLNDYFSVHRVSSFSVHKSLYDLVLLKDLPAEGVQTLNLSDNFLRVIPADSFQRFDNIRVIDISDNYIDVTEESAFDKVNENLQALNFSSNIFSIIPVHTFRKLYHLKYLDLSNNRLEKLPSSVFDDLVSVETLDLSFNKLSYLSSKHFASLANLRILYLNNNVFRTFHADVISSLSQIPSVDFSFNPFECSCAIKSLVELVKLKSSVASSSSVASVYDTVCESPVFYQGRLLLDVDVNNLNCSHPRIVNISSEQNILYRTDLYLSCNVDGYPDPSVLWFTPWGEVFSHHTFLHLLGDDAVDQKSSNFYIGEKLYFTTTVTALANGSLHINKFRGYFAGNFTCFALTPIGNVSATVLVNVFSPVHQIYIQSLIYGGMTAGAFAVLGMIFGIIITLIRRVCCTDFFMVEDKIKIPDIIIIPASNDISIDNIDLDSDKDDHDDSSPGTPLTWQDTSNSNCNSPKLYTPISESPPPGWLSSNMIETIEEVRSKLRFGVERKMETVRTHTKAMKDSGVKKIENVRCSVKAIKETGEKKMENMRTNVKSMKDSGTVYMQSIKDTSSHAAHKVRAGVVMSVETVKYTVQSMKELCGTGDIGQTISMISMETDVDSNQSKQICRSVTFV